jgi:predicted RNA-binding protein YlxR (DUF448 family)
LAKQDIERKLIESRVLDVNVGRNSKAIMNYVYDTLYDVNINYERNGQIKNITTQYGTTHGTWITPNVAELELLDRNAVSSRLLNNNEPFDKLLGKWEQDINEQLKKGHSGIFGNPVLIEEIGKQAHLHEDVLFSKLTTNMFVYELLDSSQQLLTKYQMTPFKGGSVQAQQQKWIAAYKKKKN